MSDDLSATPLPADIVGMLEGLTSTRAIRHYTDDPVPPEALRAMLFAATRAPSGSNRQPFRFLVLTDGPNAREAKAMIAEGARRAWGGKRVTDRYDEGSGARDDSPKARMARAMQRYVDEFDHVPVLVLPALVRYREPTPFEGASVYPRVPEPAPRRPRPRLRRGADRLALRGRGTAEAAAGGARGDLPRRHHHHRQARRPPRTGPSPTDPRACVRRGVGTTTRVGGGPAGCGAHAGGAPAPVRRVDVRSRA